MSAQDKYMAKLAAFELMSTLRSIDLFTGLSDDDFTTLARRLERSTYRWKQWVFKQGDVGDRLYIITEGEARVIRSSDGHEELLKELSVGDVFGERALLKSEPRFAGVRCTSAGRCVDGACASPGFTSIRNGEPGSVIAFCRRPT